MSAHEAGLGAAEAPGAPTVGGQGNGEYLELHFRTSMDKDGDMRREEDIAILKGGGLIRASEFADVDGKNELLRGTMKIVAQAVRDEQGHVNASVFIPRDPVEAVVRIEEFPEYMFAVEAKVIHGKGRVIVRTEDEVSVNGKKKHVKRSDVYRYIDEKRGINVVVYKILADEFTVHMVKAKIVNGRLEVYDAYDVKEILKRRGFRWDPERKCWYGKPELLEELKELKYYIDVVMI